MPTIRAQSFFEFRIFLIPKSTKSAPGNIRHLIYWQKGTTIWKPNFRWFLYILLDVFFFRWVGRQEGEIENTIYKSRYQICRRLWKMPSQIKTTESRKIIVICILSECLQELAEKFTKIPKKSRLICMWTAKHKQSCQSHTTRFFPTLCFQVLSIYYLFQFRQFSFFIFNI